MQLTIQAVNFSIKSKLNFFICKRVDKYKHYYGKILSTDLYMKLEKSAHRRGKQVEIKVKIPGETLIVKKESNTFEQAIDAASKAAIIAGLAFHSRVSVDDVYREGISSITAEDVAVAKTMNHVIKLLAIAELTSDDRISVRVHPTLIPRSHPLAAVRDAFNAVFVEAKSAGQLMFYGRGAGGAPTASAVLGDVVAVARHLVSNSVGPRESDYADRAIAPIGDTKTQFLIRLNVADKPGVLAAIAQVFASQSVSIQTVRQSGRGNDAELIVVSHGATESALSATVKALSSMDIVTKVESVLRVQGSNS